MAADSQSFVGDTAYPLTKGDSKIIRAPSGGLIGACGDSVDCYKLRQWVKSGMNFKEPPKFTYGPESDESVYWFWLKSDGSVWAGDANLNLHPVPVPCACGFRTACDLAEAAMDFGASAEDAVAYAISRCNNVGGPVQVERIDG